MLIATAVSRGRAIDSANTSSRGRTAATGSSGSI
jgi:hypothetical protein